MWKVIDSHAHIGRYGPWNCDPGMLLSQMDAAGVSLAIAGDLAANDTGAMNALRTAEMIKPFEDRLRGLMRKYTREELPPLDRELTEMIAAQPDSEGCPKWIEAITAVKAFYLTAEETQKI